MRGEASRGSLRARSQAAAVRSARGTCAVGGHEELLGLRRGRWRESAAGGGAPPAWRGPRRRRRLIGRWARRARPRRPRPSRGCPGCAGGTARRAPTLRTSPSACRTRRRPRATARKLAEEDERAPHAHDAYAEGRSRGARAFRASLVVCLNRLLLERSEVVDAGGRLVARLPAGDARAAHVRDILGTESGATVRAGGTRAAPPPSGAEAAAQRSPQNAAISAALTLPLLPVCHLSM